MFQKIVLEIVQQNVQLHLKNQELDLEKLFVQATIYKK